MSEPAKKMSDKRPNDLQEEDDLGRAYDGRLLLRLWPFVRPYRRQIWITLLLFVPIFVLELAPAWIVKVGMDLVLPAVVPAAEAAQEAVASGAAPVVIAGLPSDSIPGGWAAETLTALQHRLAVPPPGIPIAVWLACLYFSVSVALGLLSWVHQVVMATTGQHAMFDLRRAVFAHIQKLPMSFFDTMPVGRLVTRSTNDVENLAEMFSQGLVALVTDVIKMLGFAAVLFLVSPKLTLYTFAIVPVMAFAAFVFRWKVREAYRAVRVKIARINTQIQETVTGMKVVQLFSREERNLAEFDRMNADHRDAWHQSIRYDSLLFSTIEVATGVTMAVIIGVGTGLAEAGILYVFIDYMQRFFMPLRDLSAKYSVMQSAMASSERIFQLLDTAPAVRDLVDSVPATDPAVQGSVEFEHVWFRYGGDGQGAVDPSGNGPGRRSRSSERPARARRRSSSC
jgi:ABC-type multidrug transport system fused ATPase/permease subunit